MTEKYFVDTNVLFYALDNDGSEFHRGARALLDHLPPDRFVISTQVLLELANVARKKLGLQGPSLIRALDFNGRAIIEATTAEDVMSAVRLTDSTSISIWDAMIVTAAAKAGCSTLYTQDLSHNQIIAGVRIVNPFLLSESK